MVERSPPTSSVPFFYSIESFSNAFPKASNCNVCCLQRCHLTLVYDSPYDQHDKIPATESPQLDTIQKESQEWFRFLQPVQKRKRLCIILLKCYFIFWTGCLRTFSGRKPATDITFGSCSVGRSKGSACLWVREYNMSQEVRYYQQPQLH